jgi:hypothetical protein
MASDTQHPLLHHPKNPKMGFLKWGEPHPKMVVSPKMRFFYFPPTYFFQKKIFYLLIPLLLPTLTTPFSMSRIYHCQVPLCFLVLVSFHFVLINVRRGLLKKKCECEKVGNQARTKEVKKEM